MSGLDTKELQEDQWRKLVLLLTAMSVASKKPFVVTWVACCLCEEQKAFCVAYSKH